MSQPFDPVAIVRLAVNPNAARRIGCRRCPAPACLPIVDRGQRHDGVYWAGERPPSQLKWFDRNGRPLEVIGEAKAIPQSAPVGGRSASCWYTVREDAAQQGRSLDTTRRGAYGSRLTFAQGIGQFRRLVTRWQQGDPQPERAGQVSPVAEGPRSGIGDDQVLTDSLEQLGALPGELVGRRPLADLRDQRRIGVETCGRWILRAGAEAALVDTAKQRPVQARLSPDGRWLAYTSDDSGRWKIYITTFPGGVSEMAGFD